MGRRIKKVLGIKVGHSDHFRDGKHIKTPFAIGWALVHKDENDNVVKAPNRIITHEESFRKENITTKEVIMIARKKTGEYLKQTREEKGLSLEEVAKKTGLSIEQIKAIESGDAAYSMDDFLLLIIGLDCYFFLKEKDGSLNDVTEQEARK